MARKKRGSGVKRGFTSKAQWRYFFAAGKRNPKMRKLAHKLAHRTQRYKGGKKTAYRGLPRRRGASGRSAR